MPVRRSAFRSLALLLPPLALMIAAVPLVALGPPGGDWTSIGPPGGRIDALGVTLASTVLSGAADGGIFRSDDSAGHWAPESLLDVTLQRRVFAVVPDPVDPQSVFAATGALWKSGDGGSTWNQLSAERVVAVAVAPSAHLTLYAAGEQKVFRSDDGGSTLRELTSELPGGHDINHALVVDPVDPQTAYAGTDGGVFKTGDGGATWSFAGLQANVEALVADPARPGTIYAWARPAGFPGNPLWVTRDAAQTWTQPQTGPCCELGGLAVVPSPGAPSRLYVAVWDAPRGGHGGVLYQSDDGGSSWAEILGTFNIHALAIDPGHPERIYVGLDRAGILKSTDGGASWAVATTGLTAASVVGLTSDPRTPGLLYAVSNATQGIEMTTNLGIAWTRRNTGLPGGAAKKVVADPTQPRVLYAAAGAPGTGGGVARSADGGASWQTLPAPLFANDIAIDPVRNRTLYVVGYDEVELGCPGCPLTQVLRAYRSTDGGQTWVSLESRLGLDNTPGQLTAVRINPNRHLSVFLTGDRSFKSLDGGGSWSPLPLGPGIADLALDGHGHLYAADPLHDEIRVSTDAGRSWAVKLPLPVGANPRALALLRPGVLYFGGDGGVFVSTDFARTWGPVAEGLPPVPVLSLSMDAGTAHTLFAGTDGRGVFALTGH